MTKPIICFTFDDGHLNVYENAFPLFKKFGYEATTFLNSGRIGKSGFVSWDQAHDLYSNNWEIGGHTINHPQLPELNYDEAYYQIVQDYHNFQEQGFHLTSFALPSGHASPRDYDILKEVYKNIRNSIDKEMHLPLNRLDLGYFAYQTEYSPQIVKQRIIRGSINGEALIVIGFHRVSDTEINAVDNCNIRDLEEILSWVAEKDYHIMRLDDAVDELLNK